MLNKAAIILSKNTVNSIIFVKYYYIYKKIFSGSNFQSYNPSEIIIICYLLKKSFISLQLNVNVEIICVFKVQLLKTVFVCLLFCGNVGLLFSGFFDDQKN